MRLVVGGRKRISEEAGGEETSERTHPRVYWRRSPWRGMDDILFGLETPTVGVHLDEPLMTADQVAALLAVPRSSVYEYARRRHGRLPSIVVGRHRRFYRSDLEAWLTDVRDA